jgi:hypothetical protein
MKMAGLFSFPMRKMIAPLVSHGNAYLRSCRGAFKSATLLSLLPSVQISKEEKKGMLLIEKLLQWGRKDEVVVAAL